MYYYNYVKKLYIYIISSYWKYILFLDFFFKWSKFFFKKIVIKKHLKYIYIYHITPETKIWCVIKCRPDIGGYSMSIILSVFTHPKEYRINIIFILYLKAKITY